MRVPISRRHHPTLLLALLLAACSLPAGSDAEFDTAATATSADVALMHLANEGFMVEGGGNKILVDALYGEGFPEDPVVPQPLRGQLEAAAPPFDGVDLLLATHRHADHFDATAVGRFLTASPETRLLTTPQAVADLKAGFAGYESIVDRVEAIYPPENQPETRRYGGVAVTVHNLHHGRTRNPPVENLGFVIEIGGVRVLHAGDTEMDGDDFAAWEVGAEIDAALFPIWYFHAERLAWIEEHVAPRVLVPIHFPREGAEARVERVRGLLPDAPILLEPFDEIDLTPGAAPSPAALPGHDGVDLTYLANEGYLLTDGAGHKVLVDALFGDGLDYYPVVPPAIRADLEAGRPPFDGVGVVLATHRHADHFDPRAVGRFLAANPKAHLLTTPQAAGDLARGFAGHAAIAQRVRGVLPAEGESETHRFGGVAVTVYNLHHGRDRHPPVENLGFVVEIGGVRLLHVGDTEVTGADLAPLALDRAAIDVALLPTWMVADARSLAMVREHIAPRAIVPIHFARRGDDRETAIRRLLPAAPILRRPLATTRVEAAPLSRRR